MTAAKIRLLFAVFSSVRVSCLYFLFSKKCQFVLCELVRRLYSTWRGVTSWPVSWLLCLLHKQRQGLQLCVAIYYLALLRSMIVAIEQISFIGWNPCMPRTFLFSQGKVGSSIQSINVLQPEPIRATLSINKFEKFGRHVCRHFTAWFQARLWRRDRKLTPSRGFAIGARARSKNYREPP